MTSVWTFMIFFVLVLNSCQNDLCKNGVLYFNNMYAATPQYTPDGKIATCKNEKDTTDNKK